MKYIIFTKINGNHIIFLSIYKNVVFYERRVSVYDEDKKSQDTASESKKEGGYFMKNVPIMKTLLRVPGGLVIFPIAIGCSINTLFPQVLEIGGATTALATGTSTLLGAFFVCMGASLQVKNAPKAIKVGAVATFSKLFLSIAIGVLISKFFNDSFLGISSLALIAGMSNSNGGMFAALTKTYGDEADQGAIAMASLNDGPFFTMIALGTAGLASIPIQSLGAAIIPLILGVILGNLDEDMKKKLDEAAPIVTILLSLSLGCGMHFGQIVEGGLPGILLGLITAFVGAIVTVPLDRLTGGTGIAGAAISSTGGNAVATPMAIAEVDPRLHSLAYTATAQVAASVLVTAICCPFITAFVAKKFGRRVEKDETEVDAKETNIEPPIRAADYVD